MYKEFFSEQDAEEWIIINFKKYLKMIQAEYQKKRTLGYALYCYSGSGNYTYNKLLSSTKESISELKMTENNKEHIENIKIIHNAFKYVRSPENIILYRYEKVKLIKYLYALKKQDNIIQEKKFLSTTMLPFCNGIKALIKNNKYNILLKINLSKNSNILPIQFSEKQTCLKEHEILLPYNLAMKVTKKYIKLHPFLFVLEVEVIKIEEKKIS